MIEIKDLSVDLGEFHLKNINLSIKDREYFVILGPTGAGKTILLECIAGLHKVKQGEIRVNGPAAGRKKNRLCTSGLRVISLSNGG